MFARSHWRRRVALSFSLLLLNVAVIPSVQGQVRNPPTSVRPKKVALPDYDIRDFLSGYNQVTPATASRDALVRSRQANLEDLRRAMGGESLRVVANRDGFAKLVMRH